MRKNTEYLAVNKQLQSEIDYRVIGRHMQAIRQKCGMTQAVVAEKMKLGVKYYAALEAGTESISLSRLIQFICLMQSSSDTLRNRSIIPRPDETLQSCDTIHST